MKKKVLLIAMLGIGLICLVLVVRISLGHAQPGNDATNPAPGRSPGEAARSIDPVQDAMTVNEVPATRPEQTKAKHERSDVFDHRNAEPSSAAFENQPEKGRFMGFGFCRDSLDAKRSSTGGTNP